jgi:chitodextrinase
MSLPAGAGADGVTLSWTAPGDNGSQGRASTYEVRFSTAPPAGDTLAWWNAAVSVANIPAPNSAGFAETLLVNSLSGGVTHYFALRAVDERGNRSPVSNVPKAVAPIDTSSGPPDTSAAPVDSVAPTISSVAASPLSPHAASITWMTDEPADGQVIYGLGSDLSLVWPVSPARTLAHAFEIDGLLAATTYSFQVSSSDSAGNLGTAGPFSFQTPAAPDTAAPAVSVLQVNAITPTGAVFIWETDEPSTGWVEYGPTPALGSIAPSAAGLATSHSAAVSDLSPNAEYHFRVVAEDGAGNRGATVEIVFRTPPDSPTPGDSAAPSVTASSFSVESPNRARIAWSTDEPTIGEVLYKPLGEGVASSASDTVRASDHEITLAGLAEETRFTFQIVARDTVGNIGVAGPWEFETPSSVDRRPPAVSGIALEPLSPTAVRVRWITDEPADSQVEYGQTPSLGIATPLDEVLRLDHDLSIGGLVAGGTYHVRILSRDGTGNLTRTGDLAVTLPPPEIAPPDTTAPRISGVTAALLGPSSVQIRWSTDEPADGQVAYGPGDERTSLSTRGSRLTLEHEAILEGLLGGTLWSFVVISADSTGNISESPAMTFETPTASDTTAPVVSGLVAAALSSFGAEIRWSTDEPADQQVEYGETEVYGLATPLDETLATAHAVRLSGLEAETTYHFRVLSRDSAGNLARTGDATFRTAAIAGAPPDTVPPVASDVVAAVLDLSRVRVVWGTNEPCIGQVEYGLTEEYGFLSKAEGVDSTEHEVVLEGLASGTRFHFRTRSTDGEGNVGYSVDGTFETGADRTPPQQPEGLATVAAAAGFLVSWEPSPSDDITGYRVYRSVGGAFEPLTPSPLASTSLLDEDVPGGASEVTYAVSSVDRAGNESSWSMVRVPLQVELFPSRPNPANPVATFRFRTPVRPGGLEAHVTLAIHNLAGALVKTLVDGELPGGEHEVSWTGGDWRGDAVASGTYLARLSAEGHIAVRKLNVLR